MNDFVRIDPLVAGEKGRGTIMDTNCIPWSVKKLEYVFDGWLGDHLVQSFPSFIITVEAANDLNQHNCTGYELDEVTTLKSEQFEEFESNVTLPEFKWLKIVGRARVDDFGLDPDGMLVISRRAYALVKAHGLQHAVIDSNPHL
jgi:hypothetical protein